MFYLDFGQSGAIGKYAIPALMIARRVMIKLTSFGNLKNFKLFFCFAILEDLFKNITQEQLHMMTSNENQINLRQIYF